MPWTREVVEVSRTAPTREADHVRGREWRVAPPDDELIARLIERRSTGGRSTDAEPASYLEV